MAGVAYYLECAVFSLLYFYILLLSSFLHSFLLSPSLASILSISSSRSSLAFFFQFLVPPFLLSHFHSSISVYSFYSSPFILFSPLFPLSVIRISYSFTSFLPPSLVPPISVHPFSFLPPLPSLLFFSSFCIFLVSLTTYSSP